MGGIRTYALPVLLALALAAIGWGHRPLADPRSQAMFAAFQAAGGSAVDLCGMPAGHQARPGCEACLISAAAALPPPAATWVAVRGEPRPAAAEAGAPRLAPACHPAWQGRAPPVA